MERLQPLLRPRNVIIAVVAVAVLVLGVLFGPLALSGPQVLGITPADGTTDANPQAEIRIELNQSPQPDSVAAAITLDPPAPFTTTVHGNTIVLKPESGLQYNTRYTLTIGTGLRNALGRTLSQPVSGSFATVPYNSVAQFGPADGSEAVALRAPLTVEFGAPVVTADEVAAAADDPRKADTLPQPLKLAPENAPDQAVAGVGRWLSPTLFGFYPQEELHAATIYLVTVGPMISTDGRARLEQPVSWKFTTEAPLLVGSRPFDGEADVPANGSIMVQLATDVDLASAQSSFRLRPANADTQVQGVTELIEGGFVFRPASPLTTGARYEASLAPGVVTRSGAPLNTLPVSWRFTVVGDLEVAQVEPLPDAQEVLTATNRISVRFNHPVVALTDVTSQASLPQPLTISPALAGVGSWVDSSTYVYSPTTGLAPSTDYTVTIAAGLQDQGGGTLRSEYSWSFQTILPQVVETDPLQDQLYAPPDEPIRIFFNQPMDRASVEQGISLQNADGALVAGTVRSSGSIAVFTPAAPLERGANYTITMQRGLKAAQGSATLADGNSVGFRVAPLPQLVDSEPQNGENAASNDGSISLIFSTPMDWASVERNLTITPKPTEIYTSTYSNEYNLYFSTTPETDYTILIGADARDPYGITTGQDVSINFRTAPIPPDLAFVGAYRVGAYNAYVSTRVPLQTVNVSEVRYRLYQVPAPQAATLISDYDAWSTFKPAGDPIQEEIDTIESERNRYQIALLELGTLEPGIYYLEVGQNQSVADRQLLVVSPYALTIKRSPEQLFIWATDLSTGKPVADLELQAAFFSYDDGQLTNPKMLGRTNADGILDAAFDSSDNIYSTLYLWSPSTQTVAFATTDWSGGIGPWDFGQPADYGSGPLVGSISTDRPIFRPEQTVYIRGALRLRDTSSGTAEGYTTPAGRQANLVISDPEGNTVISRTLTLSEFGTFNTSLPIENGAMLGSYSMFASLGGIPNSSVYGSFTVAEYRKPTFEITATPARPDLIQGETVQVQVEARYFSGGVLANAPVQWRLISNAFAFMPESVPDYRFDNFEDAYAWYRWEGDPYYGGEYIGDGTGTTDSQGRFTLDLPAELYGSHSTGQSGQQTQQAGQSHELMVDIEITDVDGQVIASQARVKIHPGAFYIGLRPEGYVTQAGQPQTISLTTVDIQGNPVAGRNLEVNVYEREWYSVREQGDDGRLYWTSNYTDTLIQTMPAATDARGRGSISFTPAAGGSYRIAATGRDDSGNQVESSAFTWAYGGDVFWGVNDTNRVDLIADKQRYKPGDTAGILVTAPYKAMNVLMTIERGSVLEHKLFTIQGTTELLQVPISADYAPNVYVSLVLVKAPGDGTNADEPAVPDLRVGLINLPVSIEQRELTITITPDKTEVGPRDSVTYAIKAADYTGKGVRAEIGLALIDKAVLSLANDPNPTLSEAFYTGRPLGVLTAQTITALVDRITVKLQPGDKGGGGAEGAGPGVRTEFPDTSYWNPSLVTADDGTAQVTVELPDNLTTWRMVARGITADTLVGQATNDIIATRPLLIRPALPRFLTAGDKPALQAVVQNNTGAAIDATVTLAVNGDQQELLTLDAPAQQKVNVPASGTVVVRWPATLSTNIASAPDSALTLRMTVQGGELEDAIEQRLPIQRYVTPEVVASAGQVYDSVTETLKPPASGAPGQIDLELTPSLAAGIYSGLAYLSAFPYECTEQTVSKFLPNAVTYRLLKQAGLDDQTLKAELEHNLATGTQRLKVLQHLDGGWGWWEVDDSNPYITAYVVQGLLEAQKAGYTVDQQMLGDGIDFLERALSDDSLSFNTGQGYGDARSYALFVLAEAGQPDRGRTVELFEQRTKLQIYGRAYLLMTLQSLGNEDERVRTLVSELMSTAMLTTSEAHWEERRPEYWTMSSNTRTSALALQALVRTDPENFLIPNAVRYLMSLRDNGHWQTTQESALSSIALAEYVAQSGELNADYSYKALLDGKSLGEGKVDRTNLADPISILIALADTNGASGATGTQPVVSGQSSLVMQKEGQGRLYYTLRMRYYVDAQAVEALDRGIELKREYIAVAPDTLLPTGTLLTQAKLSDVVQVRLTITLPQDVSYLAVEDMLPAGLEPLDASLKTVSAIAQEPELDEDGAYPYWWYFNRTEIRDNRVALFAAELGKGTYTYTYLARATTTGVFQTMPATAYQMYAPEVFGRTEGTTFTVTEP